MFDEIEIEKDVPIPEVNITRRSGLWKHLSESMEVGDSVYLEEPPRNAKGGLRNLS